MMAAIGLVEEAFRRGRGGEGRDKEEGGKEGGEVRLSSTVTIVGRLT